MKTMQKILSVVVPTYNEEEGIEECHKRLTESLQSLSKYDLDYEIIFVNDGSKDKTILLEGEIAKKDKKVRIIDFARNFGHQIAVSAGLDYAKGEAVVIIDADLQDPPAVIEKLVIEWQGGYEIVNARRVERHDSAFKKFTAKSFYKILNVLVDDEIPENVGDFRLIDKKALEVIKKMPEKNRYLRGMTSWIGFKQTFVEFERDKRFAGTTHYPLSKMLNLAKDAVFSFSSLPMKLAFIASQLFAIIAIILFIYIIIAIITNVAVVGWASLGLMIVILLSIQMFVLGIISEYAGRIYQEVRQRPLYIVREVIN